MGLRVCHVCNGHGVGDARVFYRACCALTNAGYEVHLFAAGDRTETYQTNGVTVHPLPLCSTRRERFARASQVARRAAAIRPDVFHVHEPDLLAPVLAAA